MKILQIFSILLFASLTGGEITEANRHKDLAINAFQQGDYPSAIQHYHYLIDTLHISDPALDLNLGHSYYKLLNELAENPKLDLETTDEDIQASATSNMLEAYRKAAITSNDKTLKSKAFHQLGVGFMKMAQSNQQHDENSLSTEEALKASLEAFKNALKNDPYNEDTRYNYELVKKIFEKYKESQKEKKKDKPKENEEKEKEEEEKEKKEEEKKKEEDKKQQEGDNEKKNKSDDAEKQEEKADKKKSEGEEGNEKDKDDANTDTKDTPKAKDGKTEGGNDSEEATKEQKEALQKLLKSKRLKEINMTKEKARMILEAMKAQEMQYYQNMKKGVRKQRSNKPDW